MWAPIGLNPSGEWFISASSISLADKSRSAVEATLVAFVSPDFGDLGGQSTDMSGDVQARFMSSAWVEVRDSTSNFELVGETPSQAGGGAWDTGGTQPPSTTGLLLPGATAASSSEAPPVIDPNKLWD